MEAAALATSLMQSSQYSTGLRLLAQNKLRLTTLQCVQQGKAQQATPSVEGARKAASKGIAAKGKQGKSAVKQAGAAASNGAGQPEKKKGGFLQALGLGQENVYADDDK